MLLPILIFIFFSITSINTYSFDTKMLQEMGLIMGTQMGASIANQEVAKEYQEAAEAIANDQANLNIASNSFFSNLQNIKSSQLNNISTIFNAAQNQVNVLQTKQQQELTNVENYMQAISSSNFPLSYYLDTKNIILFDQLFENSKMYTPQGPHWRNVFQVGDWMFDENNNSFWQLKAKPFLTTDESTQTALADNAHQNSIFTEWHTSTTYEIYCDITLYKTTYPFYVGIIFNKARWISGDTYGIQKYRTLGIYGDKDKKISLCFAQQQTQNPANATSIALPITPLSQIYNNQAIQKFTINQTAFQNIALQPITFHIKIKPSPNAVSYKVWSKGSVEPEAYTTITTAVTNKNNYVSVTNGSNTTKYLSENDNDIYLYHGIGFLSPGAVAEFKLNGPQTLLFTDSNISIFKKEIDNYYLDQKNKALTKSL